MTVYRECESLTGFLCASYNNATAPYILRTDHEHHRQAQRARAIRNRLNRLGLSYHETEEGRLRPGRTWRETEAIEHFRWCPCPSCMRRDILNPRS